MSPDLLDVVRRIPYGRVASYGEVGKALRHPASGYMVGRWMANCPNDVPWWRVVAKDGHFALAKRSPEDGMKQERRLLAEGVPFTEAGLVAREAFVYVDELQCD